MMVNVVQQLCPVRVPLLSAPRVGIHGLQVALRHAGDAPAWASADHQLVGRRCMEACQANDTPHFIPCMCVQIAIRLHSCRSNAFQQRPLGPAGAHPLCGLQSVGIGQGSRRTAPVLTPRSRTTLLVNNTQDPLLRIQQADPSIWSPLIARRSSWLHLR